MVYHWSFSDWKSPQVSATVLTILSDLNNAVLRMVSSCHLISMSSNSFTNSLEIDLTASTIICMTVNFTFHIYFIPLASTGTYLRFRFLLCSHCGLPGRRSPLFSRLSVFCWMSLSDRLVDIKWFVCISKSQRYLCVSFSWMDFELILYPLFEWLNQNLLHNSLWIAFTT